MSSPYFHLSSIREGHISKIETGAKSPEVNAAIKDVLENLPAIAVQTYVPTQKAQIIDFQIHIKKIINSSASLRWNF